MSSLRALCPNTVYAVRNDRLGGRLGAILNALRLADDYGAAFRFFWPSHESVSPELQHPEQLFSADFLKSRDEIASFDMLRTDAAAAEQISPAMDRQGFMTLLDSGPVRCSEALRPVALPWEDPPHIAARVAQTLGRIGFVPRVDAAMQEIRTRLGDIPLIAYHLRRGDIIDPDARASNVLWPSKYISGVYYEAHIEKTLRDKPDAKLVVFSDSPQARDNLLSLSSQVIAAETLLDGLAANQLQQDFLELYAMSLCDVIVAPGASNFSTMAAILGNSRIVPITADLSAEQQDAALDRLTQRMAERPEVFSGDADLGQNFPELIRHHRAKGTPRVARAILEQQRGRGFSKPYIHDLLAEEYFWAGDSAAATRLAGSLSGLPILTDLANAPAHAWAGLAAFAAGNLPEAARRAQIASWLHPVMPLSRLLVSTVTASANTQPGAVYPVDPVWLRRMALNHHLREIASRLSPVPDSVMIIPFEIELRDWADIQTQRLPSAFASAQTLDRSLSFIRASFRDVVDTPQVASYIGQLEIARGQAETGAALLRGALAAAPDDPFVAIRHARHSAKAHGAEAAVAEFARAAELSDGNICFVAEHARNLLASGEKMPSLQLFRRLAETDHALIELHIQTADALRRRKPDRELALSVIERACALAPGARRTEQMRWKILHQLDRTAEAEAITETFVSWQRVLGRPSSRL